MFRTVYYFQIRILYQYIYIIRTYKVPYLRHYGLLYNIRIFRPIFFCMIFFFYGYIRCAHSADFMCRKKVSRVCCRSSSADSERRVYQVLKPIFVINVTRSDDDVWFIARRSKSLHRRRWSLMQTAPLYTRTGHSVGSCRLSLRSFIKCFKGPARLIVC